MPKRPLLLVSHSTDRGTKLAIASLDNGNLMPDLISEPGYEGQASPSPDGQWLALVTDRTGRLEVVLSRFVEDGARPLLNAQRLPVSSAGGVDPHWRADGHEIIYLSPDRTLMAASVMINGNAVSIGKPYAAVSPSRRRRRIRRQLDGHRRSHPLHRRRRSARRRTDVPRPHQLAGKQGSLTGSAATLVQLSPAARTPPCRGGCRASR